MWKLERKREREKEGKKERGKERKREREREKERKTAVTVGNYRRISERIEYLKGE